MILLFEGHRYQKDLISPYLDGINLDGIKRGKDWIALSYVGYFFNADLEKPDIIYILPKVFVYKNDALHNSVVSEDDDLSKEESQVGYKAFGEFAPEQLINITESENKDEVFKVAFKKYKNFVYQLATWVYRTVHRYNERNPSNKSCISSFERNQYSATKKKKAATMIDYIMALIKFAEDNKSYFTFVLKQAHSGYNKVNWRRTACKSRTIFDDNSPIYLDLSTKKKSINYEEELLVIFFSTLRDIHKVYDFDVWVNESFKLLTSKEFNSFKKHGAQKLRALKYKYFSDKSLELWGLLYSYFKECEEITSGKSKKDILVVNSFHVVFEDMIDYLISDDPGYYPKELKEHYDGKEVDHIYRDTSLTNTNDIYYVGDSKYYRVGGELEQKSVKKQYTYAKNIIQRNIDVFPFGTPKEKESGMYFKYRDPLTEGYNITPNFFISGIVDRQEGSVFNYKDDKLSPTKDEFVPNIHFTNRLFDRDTLVLQRYNINFLYVLSLYARNKNASRLSFRQRARKAFRQNLIIHLQKEYLFFTINIPAEKQYEFVELNYRYLIGRIFAIDEHTLLLGWKKEIGDAAIKDDYVSISRTPDDEVSTEFPKGSYIMIVKPLHLNTEVYHPRSYALTPYTLDKI